ncbi:MAG: glycosyltransferase family 2 protein [Nitrospirota bacterium]
MNSEIDRIVNSTPFQMRLNELRLVQRYRDRKQDSNVSIIMPTWNRAFVIGRAIDSALKQSYTNFELIISDDGSTDNTEEVVNRYSSSDHRIKYLKSEHAGVSRARNIGLQHSTGPLIAYLDSDNVWSEHFLLLMVNLFVDNPYTNTLYCALKRVIDTIPVKEFISFRHYDRKYLLSRNYIDMNIFMHRRHLFEELGGFTEGIDVLEDWDLIVRYTKNNPPCVLECVLATYYFEKDFEHLSSSEDLPKIFERLQKLLPEE